MVADGAGGAGGGIGDRRGGGPVVAEVGRHVLLPAGDGHRAGIGRANAVFVVGRVGRKPAGQAAGDDGHGVGAGSDVGKEIIAFGIGNGGGAGTAGGADTVAQFDGHIGNARFAGILDAIRIFIQPDAVADDRRPLDRIAMRGVLPGGAHLRAVHTGGVVEAVDCRRTVHRDMEGGGH